MRKQNNNFNIFSIEEKISLWNESVKEFNFEVNKG